MKKLLLLSLLVSSLNYSMNNERAIKLSQQDEELDAKMSSKLGVSWGQREDRIKKMIEKSDRVKEIIKADGRRNDKYLNASYYKDLNASTGMYNYLRDMKIIEMLFGMRKVKIKAHAKRCKALNDAFDHELHELKISLDNVRTHLKNSPQDEMLLNQKKLVESEIKSFKKLKNRDAFYRSYMKRSEFNIFQQYCARE